MRYSSTIYKHAFALEIVPVTKVTSALFLPVSRNRMYISLGANFHHFAYNCKSVDRSSVPQAREIETLVKDRATYQVFLIIFPLPLF